ncbi:ADP-ribosylglycohydrolase family protein [Oryzifoliimicrobium ureilyticus]|uniref:ADP-ribosylglycohydrolase family protein n=1 Tax=Oryzifoliimicrobium ureilyticus TaxID=3113724 RepID=UPI0030767304
MRSEMRSRAVGCMLGQLAGDALGSLVEFETTERIRRQYPDGVREMHDGGTWNTIAGQPTDDSEMALALARCLLSEGGYHQRVARKAYEDWLASNPFDVGLTVMSGIRGEANHESQANGALMRVSPIGILGATRNLALVGSWAEEDAMITHPNPICLQINNLFARALAYAIAQGPSPAEVYEALVIWTQELNVAMIVRDALNAARTLPPVDFQHQQGWVMIAFQNAVFQLLHAPSLEDGLVNTISRGGDTDTNAAIAGALLGAVYGDEHVPTRWRETLLACRPEVGDPKVARPRPEIYWPIDAVALAKDLLGDLAGTPQD